MKLLASLRPTLLVLLGFVLGCGNSDAPRVPAFSGPPHNGALFPMPDDKGWVELVVKPIGRAGASEAMPRSQITVYFLKPELSSEFSPSDARITLELPDGSKTVELKPDTAAKGGFSSVPGSYGNPNEFEGEVLATIDGQSLTIPIAVR